MFLHRIPSKQGWINVGLAGNSFAPLNWIPSVEITKQGLSRRK